MKKLIKDRLNKYKSELQQLESPKMDKRADNQRVMEQYYLVGVIKELEYIYGKVQ